MNLVIVDYGSGNLRSVAKALERASAEEKGARIVVSAAAEAVRRADRIVLPGVGAFADCRAGIERLPGMGEALHRRVIEEGAPFLGICVGMQLMASHGFERGAHKGFGWIEGEVRPIEPTEKALKVPHMGWNDLAFDAPAHPLFEGLAEGEHAYFVHGYRFVCADPKDRLAHVDYGGTITAAVGRGNLLGTQFHPEKSQRAGLRMLANFLRWSP
jgi:glutamine amidotransferase